MKEFDAEEYYDDLVRYVEGYRELTPVSYTHLTLPTIYSV